MKIALRILLVLTLLPVVLALLGLGLSELAGCSGMDHIEHCERAWLFRPVAFLIAFVWVSVFVVPAGIGALALLGLAWLVLKWRKGEGRPAP